MRWKYDTPNTSLEVAGELYKSDAAGLLPVSLPQHVVEACEQSPHFMQVEEPTEPQGAPEDGTPVVAKSSKKR